MKIYLLAVILALFASCNSDNSEMSKKSDYKGGHGLESVSAEVLEKYRAKALPSDLVREIERTAELRTPSLGHLTPDGKKLFVNWNVTGTSQVWRLDGPNSFPVQMTGGDDSSVLRGITNDNRYAIITRDSGGDEYPSLYLQPVNGGELIKVYGGKKIKLSYLGQSKSGKELFFYANDLGPTTFAVYSYEVDTKKKELLFKGSGFWWIADVSDDEKEMIIGHAISNTAREYFLLNRKTKEQTPLLGQGEKISYDVRYSAKKDHYFVLTNKMSDFERLYLFNKKTGDYKAITEEANYDVDSFEIQGKNKERILYSVNDRGYLRVKAMTTSGFDEIKLPFKSNSALLHTYNGSTTVDYRYTVFGASYYNRLRSSFVYDWKTGKLTSWTKPSMPEINTSDYVPWTLESYKAEDGTDIPMFVKRSEKCRKKTCPVIISFHGGPEAQSKPRFSPYIEMFVKRGFTYIMPNVRGSSGYGKKWLDSDNGPKRLEVITDIRDVARYVRKNFQVGNDKIKIGVMGGSYGGYSSFMAMTMFAGEYDAGIPIVGMSSLITFLQNTAEYRRYVRESEYGYLDKDMEALKKLSAMTYIDNVKAPMLIIQGATDPRVPVGEALLFKEALDKRNIPGELIIFADEGHGVRKRKNQTLYKGHTIQFFEKHLK